MRRLGELCVRDIMTADPICIKDSSLLMEAIREFDDNDISALPVVDSQNRLAGVLSLFDLVEVIREIQGDISALSKVGDATRAFLIRLLTDHGDNTLVSDVMTRPVEHVAPDTNIVLAARMMVECGFRHLPVIDVQHRPIGIVTTTDFVKAFAEQGALLAG